ncbi:MAG: glycine--tRNA ligase subunit beta [Pseudomonadota bacterium]
MTTETLLVELGTEELPPKALRSLAEAFRDGICSGLEERKLAMGDVAWYATPRRLAVLIEDVALSAADHQVETLGPPLDRARDEDGEWTPAAIGFAKKQGIDVEALETIDTPKGARLGVRRTERGASTAASLNTIINSAIASLPIPKRMRWGASRAEFVRPVHWVVAMLGKDCDFGTVLGLQTGRHTRGHRFHSHGDIALGSPESYPQVLADHKVVANFKERRAIIHEQVLTAASELGANAIIDEALLEEVTGLVEWPVALTGSFEQRFLEVPAEALVSSMKEHQKYFHVVDDNGDLLPHFITIANIESTDPAQVIAGNERVIRPRLADAAFFFESDKKIPLAQRVPALADIVFQQQLGTLEDKSHRLVALSQLLAAQLGANSALAGRAALLAKTDLVTDMVLEFADMQGIAGSYYATHDGENPQVSAALAQQYWPKFAGDKLPEGPVACTLALADRLDTLVGIFGIGQPPTGSKDPFALRRASLAVLRILVEKQFDLDLRDGLQQAAQQYPAGTLADGTAEQVLTYMLDRFRAWYEEDRIPAEVFLAVSARNVSRPLDMHRRVLAVNGFAGLSEAQSLAAANKRVANILSKLPPEHRFGEVNKNRLEEPAEQALYASLVELGQQCHRLLEGGDYQQALALLATLREPIDNFFDGVMVNVEDEPLRDNRLNLLRQLRSLFLEVADVSLLAVSNR